MLLTTDLSAMSFSFVSLFLSVVVRSMIVVCEVTERELIASASAAAVGAGLQCTKKSRHSTAKSDHVSAGLAKIACDQVV